MNKYNPISVFIYQLYLLQLEEYNIRRFLKTIWHTKGLPSHKNRKQIKLTSKLILVTATALILLLTTAFLLTSKSLALFLLLSIFLSYFFFIFLTLALYLITPIDTIIKSAILFFAKTKVEKYPNLKIIGIAGSFGKTTFKEMLSIILAEKYKVLKTPKNINTPLGIARVILKNLTETTEILIVEMGEYYKGDIASICHLTPPDISVITGINEAHLEKMGSLQTTISTIFEIAENTKENGIVMMNADSQPVLEHYQKYTDSKKTIFYSSGKNELSDFHVENINLHEDSYQSSFDLYDKNTLIDTFNVNLLGEYAIGDFNGCLQIARELSVTINQIKKGLEQMKPVEHRLQPIHNKNTDVLVIDDSYNGNPNGVEEAIKVLAKFKKRRKLYLTPGLVETGERKREIHYNIGKRLSDVADVVVLIKNSVTPYIAEGLKDHEFDDKKIIWFTTAQDAHNAIKDIVRTNDVILFQNDWPDNYF